MSIIFIILLTITSLPTVIFSATPSPPPTTTLPVCVEVEVVVLEKYIGLVLVDPLSVTDCNVSVSDIVTTPPTFVAVVPVLKFKLVLFTGVRSNV